MKVRATLVWRGGGMSGTIIGGPSKWGQVTELVDRVVGFPGCWIRVEGVLE